MIPTTNKNMEGLYAKPLIAYYNHTENEIYITECIVKSGDDDTIFLEHEPFSYLIMNRKVFEQLDNLTELGEL